MQRQIFQSTARQKQTFVNVSNPFFQAIYSPDRHFVRRK